jgi:monoamine oxidase
LERRKVVVVHNALANVGHGVLLASYTWGGDSHRLLGMEDEEIFEEMMEGLAKIHGKSFQEIRAQFMKGVVKHWSLDSNYLGAFAAFHAYQVSG